MPNRDITEITQVIDNYADQDGPETSVADLLADLMHYCNQRGLDFQTLTDRANRYYREEIAR